MSEKRVETSGDDPAEKPLAAPHPLVRRVRRSMLSTGFSDVPGKVCPVCAFQGFNWQTTCPQGHPFA